MNEIQERMRQREFSDNLIIRVSARMMVPFIQLFGLYVIVHGHYSPGGGFQGVTLKLCQGWMKLTQSSSR